MTRWEEMSNAELIDALRREHGIRMSAVDEAKRLRAITKDKRDLIGLINQLDSEVTRLQSQTGDFWKNMHDERKEQNRRMNQRNGIAMRGLWLATRWLLHYSDGAAEPGEPLAEVFELWETAISPQKLTALGNQVKV